MAPDREKLELLAEDLQLQHVDFKGFVSEAENWSCWQRATYSVPRHLEKVLA